VKFVNGASLYAGGIKSYGGKAQLQLLEECGYMLEEGRLMGTQLDTRGARLHAVISSYMEMLDRNIPATQFHTQK
jgi:hypothetical protein